MALDRGAQMPNEAARERDRSLRRLALQLSIQLPEDPDDIRRVLEYLQDIARGYLIKQSRPGDLLRVVPPQT